MLYTKTRTTRSTLALLALLLIGALGTLPAQAQDGLIWDFCDGLQGWGMANQSPVEWVGTSMVVTQSEEAPGTYDPHISATGLSFNFENHTHLAVKVTVENAPRPFDIGVFTFRDGAAHIRPIFADVDNGEQILRLNYADDFGDEENWDLTQLRLDIPDGEPHEGGGAWPDFQDMVLTIDWIALTNDPEFEAGDCPVVVNVTGPSLSVLGDDVMLWAEVTGAQGDVSYQWFKDGQELDGATDNFLELLAVTEADSGEYTVAVTDDTGAVQQSTNLVVVEALPASTPYGVFLLLIATAVIGFVVMRRRQA